MTKGTLPKVAEVTEFLKASTFLGCLPDDALARLIKLGAVVQFAKGQVLFERGDDGDSLFCILSGRVKIHNIGFDASEVVLNFIGPGDLNGEISALDGRGRTATATALETTDAFVLQRRDLMPVLKSHPDALIEILEILCDKLRATSEIVEDNQRSLKGRAARGLLRLARMTGKKTKDGILIDLTVTQRDLGNYLGMSRENTSRQIAALAAEGVVVSKAGMIVIKDEARLILISEDESV